MRTAVVGHVEWVTFMQVPGVPAPGDIVHATDWWETPGGGGAGAAVQLTKLAGTCDFFTALGDDELGHRTKAELEALGVTVHAAFRPEATRRAITHVDATGERTITVLGARLAPEASEALDWEILSEIDAVYVTASDPDALRSARRARVVVATSRILELLRTTAVRLDAVVGSLNDASEVYPPGALDPPPGLVVRTDGERGGTFETDIGDKGDYRSPAPDGPVVDRYGAGDSFAAGLTYGLGAGMSPRAALALAARCGAAVVTGRGPFSGQLRL